VGTSVVMSDRWGKWPPKEEHERLKEVGKKFKPKGTKGPIKLISRWEARVICSSDKKKTNKQQLVVEKDAGRLRSSKNGEKKNFELGNSGGEGNSI